MKSRMLGAQNESIMKSENYKNLPNGCYHLSTDGRWSGTIFHNAALFAYGMILMGLLTLRFAINIYSFILMQNHIHIVLSGTGKEITEMFHYMVRKLNYRLRALGFPELPEGYGFKLVPIENREQLKSELIYLDRNTLEKHLCIPGGYPWGTTLIHHNTFLSLFEWTKAKNLSKRELERLTGSRLDIPENWEFNPVLGLNPKCFVKGAKFYELFPTPKSYLSRLAKDYEAYAQVAERLGEDIAFSDEEVEGIFNNLSRKHFSGRKVIHLDNNEKAKLALILARNYHLPIPQIAQFLKIQEFLVRQILNAKEYRQ